jgi:hypothetical protein
VATVGETTTAAAQRNANHTRARCSYSTSTVVPVLATFVTLASFAVLGTFARWHADDYVNALRQGPFLQQMWNSYIGESERYTAGLAWSLLIPRGIWTARILPAAAIAAWLASLFWLAMELLPKRSRYTLNGAACAALVLFATLDSAPSIGQAVYWETQLLTYTVPLILGTALLAWMAQLSRSGSRVSAGTLVTIAVANFIVAGFSEASAAVQVAAAVGGVVYAPRWVASRRGKILRALFSAAAVGAMLGLAVMAVSPATAIRAASIGQPHSVWFGISRSLVFTFLLIAHFVVFHPLTMMMTLLLGATITTSVPAIRLEWPRRPLLVLLFAAVSLVFTSVLPATYVLVGRPPSRLLIVPGYTLIIAVFAAGCLLGLRPGVRSFMNGHSVRSLALVLFTVVPLIATSQTILRMRPAARYAAAWDRRDAQLRQAAARGAADAVVGPLPERWSLVRGVGLPIADPAFEINVCIAQYYGLRSVVVRGVPELMMPEPWEEGPTRELYQHLQRSLRKNQ